jgi:imidazolonepropionase-like amidohydrolase
MKTLLIIAALALVGCTSPDASGVKVIVGAKLGTIDYSVVVIENGKITAAGPQSQVPVPKGSAITRGIGMTIEPDGGSIEPGQPANLILKGPAERKMHNGEWVTP